MAITFLKRLLCPCGSALLVTLVASAAYAGPKLFESQAVTQPGEYTFGIEGPAVDRDGNLFVVNFGKQGTIGKLAPGSASSKKYLDLPEGSVGNSIRFSRDGTMFVADYKKHNILQIKQGSLQSEVYFHADAMSQPNDMTIARDGTIYASDPNWKARSGRIWRIAKAADGSVQGQVMTAARSMGTTNGIDLSPDEKTLYVSESSSGQIWAYDVRGNELMSARTLKTFQADTVDGLRTDTAGRLLVARIQKGKIAVMQPDGALQREVDLQGSEPTNLAFGGADGKTVFVTQRQGGFIEAFRTDREGREHCLQRPGC
ncbi:SMP-30/gluconolactonase/LRE family protein [Bradyrhizobium sp. CCBAU 53421]|uniref:SMP-30/gluconolactonase/LRE family protein n=1 Tax=Bradyrhizobium sp. CCBAU 53421 TaxID=1325120 RepID=UPI00188A2714|nr:SMP-30/gluconolactonase/LRE family protein [Bradyrhizobium sp. CCBAU 53421]QOZ36485.1 SMP-30/gluconolactonase/LRE family protein [Bradyrhizobium sp. CCBAU 53421]